MKTNKHLILCIGLLFISVFSYSQAKTVKAQVEAEAGDFYGTGTGYGVVLTSPDGSCYRIRVLDGGSMTTEYVACPNEQPDNTDAHIVCPLADFILTDPTQFDVSVLHNNPSSQVVHYDPRVNGSDPGSAIQYNSNNSLQTGTYDLSNILPSSGNGLFTLEILYWYDGDHTNQVSAGTCQINYDFDGDVVNNGSLVTCDQARLAQAAPYEALFHANLDNLMTTLLNFGTSLTDAQWLDPANGAYCGVTGVQMYHFKHGVESITRMLLYAHSVGLTSHVQDYKNNLWVILNHIMPRYLSGDGTAGATGSGDYQCGASKNPPAARHGFIAATRTWTFSGYAVLALMEIGGMTAAEQSKINTWAAGIKEVIPRYMNNLDVVCEASHGGFSHMCMHPVAGTYLWSHIGGFNDFDSTISSKLEDVLNEYQASSGDLGSDLGHDTDSMSNTCILRDMQCLTGQSSGPIITQAMIKLIGDKVATRINSGENWPGAPGVSPGYEHMYCLALSFSPAIKNLIAPANNANYPELTNGTNTHKILNHFVAVASAAWGYAMKGDNENCPQ